MKVSDRQLRWNLRLCEIYPLGKLDVVWGILEGLYADTRDKAEVKTLNALFKALEAHDQAVRKNRFPIPKEFK